MNDTTQQTPDVGDTGRQLRPDNGPTRFRKLPVEIYAIRFDGTNHAAVSAFAPGRFEAVEFEYRGDDPDVMASILGGAHSTWLPVMIGDWVVVDGDGVFEVFRDAAFRAEFEAVGND